jgi:hypothetical protein
MQALDDHPDIESFVLRIYDYVEGFQHNLLGLTVSLSLPNKHGQANRYVKTNQFDSHEFLRPEAQRLALGAHTSSHVTQVLSQSVNDLSQTEKKPLRRTEPISQGVGRLFRDVPVPVTKNRTARYAPDTSTPPGFDQTVSIINALSLMLDV